ncbi:hypothetical protein LTR62_006567 [Meristemomyces frigidus]|uniref:Large ribosomal subunit protein mL59 domain-containing protein n=1 Tax=Meristemomyces frigidus TaxID=1508187 RepID=A0AAN7TN52_9PEZI|nr:hypothetical protein LTR62_006567 [Meristemomyces frigidus]
MAATSAVEHIALAQALPPRLLHFFKRFPPPQLSASASTTTTTSEPPTTTANPPRWKTNPFLPSKNPSTGHWHSPHYSLRRQADLFRLATEHNVLSLMPASPKHPETKAQKRIEHGLRVKGTGEGQRVKGKLWERTLQSRLEMRRQAMESMPDMIQLWRERGHGMGWKRFPRGKGKMGKEDVFKPDMRHAWVHERAAPGN